VQVDGGTERGAFDEVVVETREGTDEEDAVAAPHHGGARAGARAPGEAETRREVVPVAGHAAFGKARIAGEDRPRRGVGETLRTRTVAEPGDLPEPVVIRKVGVPAEAEGQGEARRGAEGVLGEERQFLPAGLLELARALREARGSAEQQVCDAVSGDLAGERETPRLLELGVGVENDVRRELAAGVDRVSARGPRERVVDLGAAPDPLAEGRIGHRAPA